MCTDVSVVETLTLGFPPAPVKTVLCTHARPSVLAATVTNAAHFNAGTHGDSNKTSELSTAAGVVQPLAALLGADYFLAFVGIVAVTCIVVVSIKTFGPLVVKDKNKKGRGTADEDARRDSARRNGARRNGVKRDRPRR